jgi:hypothetical protein
MCVDADVVLVRRVDDGLVIVAREPGMRLDDVDAGGDPAFGLLARLLGSLDLDLIVGGGNGDVARQPTPLSIASRVARISWSGAPRSAAEVIPAISNRGSAMKPVPVSVTDSPHWNGKLSAVLQPGRPAVRSPLAGATRF